MKKILSFFFLLFLCTKTFATPINEIVFLGDSLSDNGNLYSMIKIIPKSPPYFRGRFTNGVTWAERVGNYYYDKSYADYHIYAVGGATAILHDPNSDNFLATVTLTEELYTYLAASKFSDKAATLYVIWIGANDYLYERTPDTHKITTEVVDNITWTINTLISRGGKNFLILNLPNLGRIPYALENDLTNHLSVLTKLHNQKLAESINHIQTEHADVTFYQVDVDNIFNDLLDHPEKYNEKYHSLISNVTQGCWTGGVLLNKTNENSIQQELKINNPKATFNAENVARFIQNSPALRESYNTSKSFLHDLAPCDHPEQYLFWDSIHPTAIIHDILSQIVIEKLTADNSLSFVKHSR